MHPFFMQQHQCEDSVFKDYGQHKTSLLPFYPDRNGGFFLFEATRALNTEQLADHLKVTLQLEVPFSLKRSFSEPFPAMRATRTKKDIFNELTAR